MKKASSIILPILLMVLITLQGVFPCIASSEKIVCPPVKATELSNGKLAMVAFMLEGKDKTEKEWTDALKKMKSMGVQVVEIGQISWTDTEPKKGKYNWTYAEKVLKINKEEKLGLTFIADIGMFINPGLNGEPKVPGYLKGLDFDDPKVITALSNMYKSFFKLDGSDSVQYLFQHFENAEASLKKRKKQREKVKTLLRESFKAAKSVRPDIKTGVCIQSYAKPDWPANMIKEWNLDLGTDVVPIISFSPNHFDKSAEEEFVAVKKRCQGRPIALHECWYHSSKKAKSSPEKQAQFIKSLFAVLKKHHDDIEFATWYEYQDLNAITANFIGVYLAAISFNPFVAGAFKDRMGSCGLFTNKKKAKEGARTWCIEANKYYEFRKEKSE